MTDAASSIAANPTARRRGLTLIAAAVALVGLGWGGWHWLQGRHHQTTDNAYVAGNVVQITPQVGGTVVAILADDNDGILTPADPAQRGCQLSLRVAGGRDRGRALFEFLAARGVLGDWREPDVIRISPAPLYNTYADVLRFVPGEIVTRITVESDGQRSVVLVQVQDTGTANLTASCFWRPRSPPIRWLVGMGSPESRP